MVPIWVSEPMGFEMPRRIASTPAMNVVATAPMPGQQDAELARGGADVDGFAGGLRVA